MRKDIWLTSTEVDDCRGVDMGNLCHRAITVVVGTCRCRAVGKVIWDAVGWVNAMGYCECGTTLWHSRQHAYTRASELCLNILTKIRCDAVFLKLRITIMDDAYQTVRAMLEANEEIVEISEVTVREMETGLARKDIIEIFIVFGSQYGIKTLLKQFFWRELLFFFRLFFASRKNLCERREPECQISCLDTFRRERPRNESKHCQNAENENYCLICFHINFS